MNKPAIAIIEDEIPAARLLHSMIARLRPEWDITVIPGSVEEATEWFATHPHPDLLFLDIQLADGNSFDFLSAAHPSSTIIFTTAYDQYAVRAFTVNSIDYILKPIKKQELERAFEKFKRLSGREKAEYVEQTQRYLSARAQSFLIPFRDKLVPLTPDEIAYCYTADEKVSVVTFDGRSLPMDKPLDTLIALLPERDFYRANRQFIVSRRAVRDLSVWFGSRLSVNLTVKTPERIVVSKARVPDFKKWFTGN